MPDLTGWIAARRLLHVAATPTWEPMRDGPPRADPWEPWQTRMEAAPGLTIGSPTNTEPVARFSGYLLPAVANARLAVTLRNDLEAVLDVLEATTWLQAVDTPALRGLVPELLLADIRALQDALAVLVAEECAHG